MLLTLDHRPLLCHVGPVGVGVPCARVLRSIVSLCQFGLDWRNLDDDMAGAFGLRSIETLRVSVEVIGILLMLIVSRQAKRTAGRG